MADYDSSLPIRTETDGDVVSKIVDGTGSNAWEIDVNNIGQVNLNDGTNQLTVNGDGSINVNQVSATVGDDIHVYNDATAGVPGTPVTVVNYTVSAGKTLLLKTISASASGKAKIELKTGVPASEVLKAVGFISTATGTIQMTFPQPIEVAATDKVLVIVTNKDNANQDLYAYINGLEV